MCEREREKDGERCQREKDGERCVCVRERERERWREKKMVRDVKDGEDERERERWRG